MNMLLQKECHYFCIRCVNIIYSKKGVLYKTGGSLKFVTEFPGGRVCI